MLIRDRQVCFSEIALLVRDPDLDFHGKAMLACDYLGAPSRQQWGSRDLDQVPVAVFVTTAVPKPRNATAE